MNEQQILQVAQKIMQEIQNLQQKEDIHLYMDRKSRSFSWVAEMEENIIIDPEVLLALIFDFVKTSFEEQGKVVAYICRDNGLISIETMEALEHWDPEYSEKPFEDIMYFEDYD